MNDASLTKVDVHTEGHVIRTQALLVNSMHGTAEDGCQVSMSLHITGHFFGDIIPIVIFIHVVIVIFLIIVDAIIFLGVLVLSSHVHAAIEAFTLIEPFITIVTNVFVVFLFYVLIILLVTFNVLELASLITTHHTTKARATVIGIHWIFRHHDWSWYPGGRPTALCTCNILLGLAS
jgi:hypothetical protein